MNKSLSLIFSLLITQAGASFAQTCYDASVPGIVKTSPTSNFTLYTDGTALDKTTGLIWKRCVEGQTWTGGTCTGTAMGYTWQEALKVGNNAVFAGKSDWRLPNLKESLSIHEWACLSPEVNITVFPNFPDAITWTSTSLLPTSDFGSDQAMGGGSSFQAHTWWGKVEKHNVQLVRGGQ